MKNMQFSTGCQNASEAMKNKGLSTCAQTVKSRIGRFQVLCTTFILLFTLGVGQMWADKKVWIDVENAPSGYTDKMQVQYYSGSSYTNVWASEYGSVNGRSIWYADIPDGATKWEVHRGDGLNGGYYNWQGEQTYSSVNYYKVTGWDGGGTVNNVIGMVRGGYIYFDNSITGWTGKIQFVVGHSSYSRTYEMTQLTGTKIWYVNLAGKDNHEWNDAKYYAFISSTDKVADGSWGSSSLSSKATKYTAAYTSKYNLDNGSTYWCVPSGSSNGSSFSIDYKSGYSNIPTNTMTVTVRTKVTGGSYGNSYNSPTTVTVQTRYLSNNGTSSTQSANVSTSAKSNNKADVTTGEVNFSYTALDDDAQWAFDGWGTSNSTVSSTNSTYRITAGSDTSKTATTIYAFFTRKPVLTVNCGSHGTSASGSATNNAKTSYSLSATAADGYRFKEWTVGSGSVTFSDNTSATSTATISADATITATFEEIPAGQLEVVAGSNGKVKIDGEASWTSDSYSYTDITSAGDYNIYAQANDHYHFVNWTKSGDGSIKTNAATGVYSMTANGVATVTANFAETQHNVTVQYKCSTAVIKTATTKSNVGEVTAASQAAPAIDGYTFSAWTIESGITKTSGQLTDATLYFKTNSSGTYTITANYTAKSCNLVKLSAGKNGSETTTGTDAGAMTFDPTTKAYYKDITTTASPYYFRFTYNSSTKYCSDWKDSNYAEGKEVAANTEGSKVTCDQSVGGWTDKPAMYYSGAVGSKLRVWFDYQNKKVWTTASLNEQFVLRGSKYDNSGNGGMPGWDATTSYFSGLASGSSGTKTVTLEAGVKYKVKAYDMFTATYKGKSTSGEQQMADNTYYAVGSGGDFYFTSTAAGTYTFTYHTSSGLKVQFPVSYTVNFNAETFLNGGASHSTSTTGGTVAAVDGNETTFTSGSKIISGGTVVITATKNTGYDFDGFFTNANCTTEISGAGTSISDNVLTYSSISGNKTAYAKFSEKMTTVTLNSTAGGHIEIGGATVTETTAGVTTTRTIVAVPDANYYFAGWTVEDGSDCTVASTAGRDDNESSSTTLRGSGAGTTGTVTACFLENEKIYFRNIFDDGAGNVTRWSNVYAYYGITWADGRAISNSNASYKVAMTRIGASDVYWAYVPRAFTQTAAPLGKQVAFSSASYGTSFKFYNSKASADKAATRGDYNKALNMFVPYHTAKSINTGSGGVDYFDNGYWMKYDTKASQGVGYYLKVYNSRNNYTQKGEFVANTDDATTISFKVRVDNTADDHNRYMITSAGALNYLSDATIQSNACTNVGMSENLDNPESSDVYFQVKATSEGYYTFIIDQTSDKMKLTVDYPVSPGDYRLKHTYNDGSAKTTYSDIIKGNTAATAKTYSMYLSTAGTETLVLQKCTSINASTKLPEWSAGDATNLSTVLSKVGTDGNGVYQLDVTVNTSTDKVSAVENVGQYEGEYYIKTDVADGGWVNYTQNVMGQNSINFDPSKPETFDYYYCKYVGAVGTNIKCVIANDYCNQLSDTLIGDDIIGAGNQTMPYSGSVRFSYNSATNTIKRAYINGSGDWERYFLELQAGSAVIKTRGGDTYADNKVKFSDNGNWIYNLELQAQEGARIKLVSHYYNGTTTKDQYFKGASGDFSNANTEELIGGTGDTWQPLTVIYDFKTNNLISAWTPSGDIGKTINLKTDVMLIHNRKKIASPAPTYVDEVSLINFTGDYQLQNIDKVYSAFRFQKTSDANYVGLQETSSNNAQSYYRYNYWISFPYNVCMTDIFGINGYGSKWRIQRYRGDLRAANGFYQGDGTSTFWETVPMTDADSLYKGEGYVMQLSPSTFKKTGSGSLWELSSEVYLYFPSKSNFGNITKNTSSVSLAELTCTKGAFTDGQAKSHDITDSHWHVFGIPTFNDATGTTGTGIEYHDDGSDGYPESHTLSNQAFYFYKYNNDGSTYNTYTATSSSGFTFQPMHAYMIQMYGTLNFTANSVPASVAARRSPQTANYNAQIELQSDGEVRDQTFVALRDSALADFAFNEELMKIHNSGKTNIYSYAGVYDVAANVLPIENTTVALGVEIAANGTYSFHMPDNFSGTVTLFDNVTNTRTNLGVSDYTLYLEQGTYEGRFYLEFNVMMMTTAIDQTGAGQAADVRKVLIDGILYLVRDGRIYSADGQLVK